MGYFVLSLLANLLNFTTEDCIGRGPFRRRQQNRTGVVEDQDKNYKVCSGILSGGWRS
jgi:hypothetical protein